MRAAKLAVVLLLVACGSLAGASFFAEEPTKETAGQAEKKKKKDGRKEQKPGPAGQAAPEKPAPASQDTAEEPGYVYTNDDLDRLAPPLPVPSGPAPTEKDPAAKAAPEAYDPLKQMQEEQTRAAELQTKIADAEKRVTAAEARVKDLEQRALAVKNPYLARPKIPAEQAGDWKKMDGTEREQATQDELAQARKEVDSAKADLQKLRSGG